MQDSSTTLWSRPFQETSDDNDQRSYGTILGDTTVDWALTVLGDDFQEALDDSGIIWTWHFCGCSVMMYPFEHVRNSPLKVHFYIERKDDDPSSKERVTHLQTLLSDIEEKKKLL